jgi:hypothetical protein
LARFGIDLGKIMIKYVIDICQILKNGIIIQRNTINHSIMEVGIEVEEFEEPPTSME